MAEDGISPLVTRILGLVVVDIIRQLTDVDRESVDSKNPKHSLRLAGIFRSKLMLRIVRIICTKERLL